MCRFVAYIGRPLILDEVLFQPKNSLVNQSVHAREMQGEEPLNGDGFGLGWYNPEINDEPALFTSIHPAWNDRNLRYITPKIISNCFMAHIRAASQGGVTQFNCHPFHHHRFLFMHNGNVGGFTKLKRHIRHKLSDDIYDWVKGQTDSEHIAALFLQNFYQDKKHFLVTDIANTLVKTFKELLQIHDKYGSKEPCYLNYVITDGRSLVATRYTTSYKKDASTLYYSYGDHFTCEEGVGHIVKSAGSTSAVLVASEKLDRHKSEWHEIPVNHMLLVNDDLQIDIQPIV